MFISVQFETEDGLRYYEPVNLFYIQQVGYANAKDVDAGCVLLMKDGRVNYTPDTMDVLAPLIHKTWRDSAAILLTQIAAEYSQQVLDDEERNKVIKKKRTYRKRK